jgi:hypothetical protein
MALSVFEQVNKEIFGGVLGRLDISIKRKHGRENTYALYCENALNIYRHQLRNCGEYLPQQIFAIVAHETIHHAQKYYKQNYGHNTAFFRHFAKRIQLAYGHEIAALQTQYIGK